jgi:hypothetical protein
MFLRIENTEFYASPSMMISRGEQKKPKNQLNRKNRTKNNRKKPIKLTKILKKPTGSVRFRFYKPETEKTEPNRNRKKTEPNRFLS